MKENIVQDKSYDFAIRIVKLYQKLKAQKEFDLSSQILRSGTSIGANIEEAIGGQSRKYFGHKLAFHTKKQGKQNFG